MGEILIPVVVVHRLRELKVPVEAIQNTGMNKFFTSNWVMIVRDFPSDRVAIDLIGPKCPCWSHVQELLARDGSGE